MIEILNGPQGAFVKMSLFCAFIAVLVGAVKAFHWSGFGRSANTPTRGIESSSLYRRCLVAAASASGSRQSWDRNVRPLLNELAEISLLMAGRDKAELRHIVSEQVGHDMWNLLEHGDEGADAHASAVPRISDLDRIVSMIETILAREYG